MQQPSNGTDPITIYSQENEWKDLGYKYPLDMDLRPNSPLHNRLVEMIKLRIFESYTVMSKRIPSWDAIDQMLTAYMPMSAVEQSIKAFDRREPVSLMVPATFAALETHLTYMNAAFFQEQQIFHYTSRNPESTVGAMLLDLVVSAQSQRFAHSLALGYAMRDGFAYGYGALTPRWRTIMGRQRKKKKKTMLNWQGQEVDMGHEITVNDAKLFEGNELCAIDPRRAYPDPGVPIHQPQKGEYWGFMTRETRLGLIQRESQDEDGLFNCRYIKHRFVPSRFNMGSGSRDVFGTEVLGAPMLGSANRCDVVWCYIRLIPSEWGLKGGDDPQIWLFAIEGDWLLIAAEPVENDHNMLPVAVNAPDTDGYSNSPIARLEITNGLQEFMNALVNMHVSAKRTANNRHIIDPAIANIVDYENTKEGGAIKIRKAMQGLGKIDQAILNVPYADVTQGNLADMSAMLGLMNNLMGTPEQMQGVMRAAPERLTGSEAQSTKVAALSKMERLARIISSQMFQPLGYMIASQTIQYLEDPIYVQLVGRSAQDLAKEFNVQPGDMAKVEPSDLMVDFDVVVSDGSIAGNGNAQVLAQMFQSITSQPEIASQFDLLRLAEGVYRAAGENNVMDYLRTNNNSQQPAQVSVVPDEQIKQMVDAKNIYPIGATG